MSELKTIKTMNKYYGNYPDINSKELKQTAIKWIKELRFRKSYMEDKGDVYTSNHWESSLLNTIDWIKHFFGITDKDIDGDSE